MEHRQKLVPGRMLLPFILVTTLFFAWGFANDITNPMVKAFSKIFRMSVTDGALVQLAFYGGYFVMALPAALFIRRFTYKAGILMGLSLYSLGSLLFIPAGLSGMYYPFLIAYFILTCGLSFLETSANPYILSMGSAETATRRLNLAQAFNPIGSLLGMYVAMNYVQGRMNPMGTAERATLSFEAFEAIKMADITVLVAPYVWLGIVIVFLMTIILLFPMPRTTDKSDRLDIKSSFRQLLAIPRYREGVIAQFFYVGVQIMCWTFIIQYGTRIFVGEGMTEQQAEIESQSYNIIAMLIFCISRFICTYLLKYFNPGRLLMIFAIISLLLVSGVIFFHDIRGMYCLVGISACMSLMFPTIYGLSLEGLGDNAKLGAAGLIMAILGGSVMPPLQAMIIDMHEVFGMPSVNISFIIPAICFVVIAAYGYKRS